MQAEPETLGQPAPVSSGSDRELSATVYMLLSAFFFALMNLCVKLLPRIPTHEIVFFRSLGMLLVCLVLLRQYQLSLQNQPQRDLFLRGLFGTLGLLAYFQTLKHMPLASAVTLQYLNPIFATWLAIYLLGEKVRLWQWLFFALSFAGVVLVKGFDAQVSGVYLALGVFAAACSGCAYNYVRKLRGRTHPVVVIFSFAWVSLALLGPYTLLNWVWPRGWEWLWLFLIGGLTYVAQIFMTRAYQAERMALVASLNYTGVLYALALGWLVFGEVPSLWGMVGMLLIIIGVLLGSQQNLQHHIVRILKQLRFGSDQARSN